MSVSVSPLLDDGYVRALYAGRSRFQQVPGAFLRRVLTLTRSGRYDLLWIQHELFPWFPAWGETVLKMLKMRYVVDYDDAIFHRYEYFSHPLLRRLMRRKIDRVMQHAAMVLVGNTYLEQRARQAGSRLVRCLPTPVNLASYPESSAPNNKVFTIGWIGTPLTCRYLKNIVDALTSLCQRKDARLLCIGGDPALPGIPVDWRPWAEESEVQYLQSCDIGIMPLPDEPYERGKCGYKLLQYMACGRAVVASPVGMNQTIVTHGLNGFLARTNEEWIAALEMLREDVAMRTAMGRAGRRCVETDYSLNIIGPKLEQALLEACSN